MHLLLCIVFVRPAGAGYSDIDEVQRQMCGLGPGQEPTIGIGSWPGPALVVGSWPGTNFFCWFLARNKQLLLGPGQEPTIVAGSRPGTNNCCWALARDQQTLLGPGQEPTIVAGTPAGRRYPPKDFLFQGALALWPLTLLLELPGQFCSDSCPSPAIW